MNDKTVIDGIDVNKCQHYGKCSTYCYVVEELCSDNPNCYYKQLKRKEQECEELKKIIKEAKSSRLDLQSFLVCEALGEEYEQQIDQLKAENEELIRRITKIFACLIKANRTNKIVDTLWVDRITTLWDYIALTLGIEGDQTQIEEQILRKIS